MLKNWIVYLLSLLGVYAFFVVYQMWLSWYCLLVILLIPVISVLLSVIAAYSFKIRIKAPHRATIKLPADLVFTTSTTKYLPGQLYSVRMTLAERMSGEKKEYRFCSQIGTDKEVRLDTEHCGTYVIETIKVRVYDMFGLIPIPRKTVIKGEIPVMPVVRLPSIVSDSNGFRAKLLSKSQTPYSEIYDIRGYIEGDPIKSIHWKISAKKDEILVREPQEETHGRARVIMPLEGTRDKVDQNLGEVLFTIRYFLIRDIPVTIRVISRVRRAVVYEIRSKQEMEHTLLEILRMPVLKGSAGKGGLGNE